MSNQPGEDPERTSLTSAVVRAIRAMQGATHEVDLAAARRLGVNRTDLVILGALQSRARSPRELAEVARITPASTTVALRRLAAQGLVRRLPDPDDGRRATVELSPAARTELDAIYGPLGEAGQRLLSDYSAEQLDLIRGFAERSTVMQQEQAERIVGSDRA